MKFKKGDTVRVKSFDELLNTFDAQNIHNGEMHYYTCFVPFEPSMKKYCGKIFTVYSVSASRLVYLKNNGNIWHPDWLVNLSKRPVR